jgi:hypothetical protein
LRPIDAYTLGSSCLLAGEYTNVETGELRSPAVAELRR